MNWEHRIKKLLLIYSIVFLNIQLLAKEEIRVGSIPYSEFIHYEDNKASGIFVDHLNSYLQKKFKVKWVEIPIARGIFSLESNYIDVYVGLRETQERSNKVDFAKEPIIITQLVVCRIAKEKDKSFKIDDLNGKKVAYPAGTVILEELKNRNIEFVNIGYSDDHTNRVMKILRSGHADFANFPESHTLQKFIKSSELECLDIGPKVEIVLAFPKNSKWKKKVEELNIKAMKL